MPNVFVSRALAGRAIAMIEGAGHVVDVWPREAPPSPAELLERIARADGVVALLTDRFDAAGLAAAPPLRIVANMAVGYDNVDVPAADAAGVWVSNTPGVLHETTADFTMALMLAAARNIVQAANDATAGRWTTWSPTGYLGPDIHGATLGVVGLGEIGTAVARRARGFGMDVLYASRTRKPEIEAALDVRFTQLDVLLEMADFVTLHAPLTVETTHLIGREALRRMKPTAILVNTARGGIIDQAALVEALQQGEIGGAALDVTTPEPLAADHPLFRLPNALVTPHIASASHETRARMAEMAAQNVIAALRGERPPNAVNEPTRLRTGVPADAET